VCDSCVQLLLKRNQTLSLAQSHSLRLLEKTTRRNGEKFRSELPKTVHSTCVSVQFVRVKILTTRAHRK